MFTKCPGVESESTVSKLGTGSETWKNFIQVSYPHNQFLQATGKCQYSKLSTIAHKQILCKPIKKRGKSSRLKYSFCVTGSTSGVT